MLLLQEINKWFSKYKNSLFIYKDGFFVLPFLSNTPAFIVQSIIKMPFARHFPKKQIIKANNPFLKGGLYYEEIEDGFWLIVGDLFYKTNVNYRRIIDNKIPTDYYSLSLNVLTLNDKPSFINDVSFTNVTWLLFKPREWNTNCRFKGTKELSITYSFNETWLRNALFTNEIFNKSQIRHFFDSKANYILFPDEKAAVETFCEKILNNFLNTNERTIRDKEELHTLAYKMIFHFVEIYKKQNIPPRLFEIPDGDRVAVYKVEKILLENLSGSFPGIEHISQTVGVSTTKLSANFKIAFGKPIFQYFQEKQMLLAKELLLENKMMIKDLAKSMGYENAGKFSATFKKQNGRLPSGIV